MLCRDTSIADAETSMQYIIPFRFESKDIRVLADERGEPLFVGKDICLALGYADPTNAMKQHCRGVVKRHPIVDSLGRTQKVRVLTEADMFRLVVSSTLPSAEAFERLVFEEILPAIRKTGSYVSMGATLESLPPAIARQVGGIIKAVVHKEVSEALTLALPALIHGELAKQRTGIRHGVTAGQIWHDHGLPTKGLRGYPSWFGNRLAGRGRARRQHVAVVLGDYARAGDLRASSSIAFAIGSIS